MLMPEFTDMIRELLNTGHGVTFVARGRSMKPFICSGTPLCVSPVLHKNIRIGDVLLYQAASGQAIAHRLIKRTEEPGAIYYTAADNETQGVSAVPAQAIIGRVDRLERKGGRIVRWLGLVWYYLRPVRRVRRVYQTRLMALMR